MKYLIGSTVLLTFLNACHMSNTQQKYSVASGTLSRDNAMAHRPTISNLNKVAGVTVSLGENQVAIRSVDSSAGTLYPVNMPPELQKAGIQVVFSGELKQVDPAELWAAQPVLLLAIETK